MIKKWGQFILEAEEADGDVDKTPLDISDLKSEVREMIENSLKTSDIKTIDDFIKAYIRNPEETQIEGLINDSGVYEFYLKYRNDIDELLSNINFYDEVPSELGSFSLYDYVIRGTKRAIEEVMNDLSGGETTENES